MGKFVASWFEEMGKFVSSSFHHGKEGNNITISSLYFSRRPESYGLVKSKGHKHEDKKITCKR